MRDHLIDKIKSRQSTVAIIGLGYVGLPLAREFLKNDFSVLGFDTDTKKVDMINRGESYIEHIDSDFISHYQKISKLSASSDFSRLNETDFILICVPTPLDEHLNPDLKYVMDTTRVIADNLREGHTIVLESTTYPGTTEEEMLPELLKSGLKIGEDFFLGYSPEREDPGNKDFDTGSIPKVISAVSENGLKVIDTLYSSIVKTVPVSTTKVAESSKILENTYRAINIALVNELKMVFDRMGIDVWEVIEAASTKPFGFKPFYPGPGLGGHCIPIDPFYLTWKAKEYDIHTRFIELAGMINTSMPYYVLNKTIKTLNCKSIPIKNAKILIVGVAYKPDIDDMRESPALKIIDLLKKEGAEISYYDPFITNLPKTRKYNLQLQSIKPDEFKNEYFDLGILVTDHETMDYKNLLSKTKNMIDTRNAFTKKGIVSEKIIKA